MSDLSERIKEALQVNESDVITLRKADVFGLCNEVEDFEPGDRTKGRIDEKDQGDNQELPGQVLQGSPGPGAVRIRGGGRGSPTSKREVD